MNDFLFARSQMAMSLAFLFCLFKGKENAKEGAG
jgi:hypothetical protein